ncbi:MAG: choice-of-anchor D domain-containing protein [Acidobacteriaceae bacterium]
MPASVLMRARAQHAAMVRAQPAQQGQGASTAWQPVGPLQVNTAAWGLVTGRITSLSADPSDPTGNTLYVGATGGGVWKSTNVAGSSPSFAPLTDDLGAFSSAALSSLSIGAVSVQPGGTGVLLAGTGDPNDATDSWYGAGLLRSADNGNTWSLITLSTAPSGERYSFAGNAFAGFAWSTVNSSVVVAAVSQSEYGSVVNAANPQSLLGLYYSQDAGQSWQLATIQDGTQVIESSQMAVTGGNAATAVVWNPIRKSFYAAVRFHGYYSSPDGVTWTRLANQPGVNLTTATCPPNAGSPGSEACPIFRGALAVQPVTGDLFALTVDLNNLDQGLWQDACNLTAGQCASPTVQFSAQIADQPLDSVSGDGSIPEGDYNLWLAAVPSQQDTLLFVGTADIWKCSLANSCVWRNTTNAESCAAAQVAPAQHAIETTFGSSGLLYFGNDGGLWRSTDAVNQQQPACSPDDASHFQNLNGGIGSLAEVESFAQDPNDPSTWLAALGEMGTAAPSSDGSAWNQVLDGEGNVVAVDPVNPQNWYATSEFGVGVNQCTAGTACNVGSFGAVAIGEPQVDNDVQIIPAPWILDPANTANLILGTCRVWRGAASGAGWSTENLLSPILDVDQSTNYCNGDSEIRSLAAGPNTSTGASGSEAIYAGMAGTIDGGGLTPGHLFAAAVNDASAAANTVWSDETSSPVTNDGSLPFNPGTFDISSIYADPHDPTGQTVYVTVQGYSTSSMIEPSLYRSEDGGAHWTNLTSNLPPAPANSVVVDPNNANIVYVALDTGVYITQDVSTCVPLDSACWNVYGSGLPNAPVIGLMAYNQGATQTLRAATYGRGIWQVGLATAGIAPTTVTVSPGSLIFAGEQVQTVSALQTVTVTNTGTLNLNVSSVSITGDFAETDTCSGESIAPQSGCQLQVTFDPTTTGARGGTVTIFANVTGGQLSVPLSGTGLAPADVVLAPASLAFGSLTVGSTSAAQDVTINNMGGEPVTLTGETVSSGFAVTANTCGSSLPANTGCTVSIAFTPVASGAVSGALTVTDALGTQTAQLSGTGQSPATDNLSPLSLSFASQQVGTTSASQTVTLTNSGDQTLTQIAVTVAGDFVAVNGCGSLLQGHGSCTIVVAYTPTMTGSETGSLTVADELRSQTVSLTGTGLAPPGVSAAPRSIDFGGYAAGTASSAQTVTVTNSGGYALTGLAEAVTADFSIASNNCPATLGVGAACQIGVVFSAPSAAGPVTGAMTISATNLPSALTVSLAGAAEDFSIATTGSSSAVVTSGQTAAFTLQLSGLGGTSGTVTLACSGAPQNATCSFGLAQNGACPAAGNATVPVSGANTSTASVCIATGVAPSTTSAQHTDREQPWGRGLSLLAMVLPLPFLALRRKRLAALLALAAVLVLIPAGCGVNASSGSGGTKPPPNATPPGAYVLTATGTMSNLTHSVALNLTVQ